MPKETTRCVTKKMRQDWEDELTKKYPGTDPYFIGLLLDSYEKNPSYVDQLIKTHKKNDQSRMKVSPAEPESYEIKSIEINAIKPEDWPEQDSKVARLLTEEEYEQSTKLLPLKEAGTSVSTMRI